MSLFVVEDGIAKLNTEARLINEFKAIIVRDKDRKKSTATKELGYVYFMADHKSPYSTYSIKERTKFVTKDLKLPADWKEDKIITAAIEKYVSLMATPATRSLVSIKDGLISSANVITALRKRIDKTLEDLSDEEEDSEIDDISSLIDTVKELLTLSEKLPKAISTIEALEEKVKLEQSGNVKTKGGGEIGQFEE